MYNLVQRIPFDTPSLEDTIQSITHVGVLFRVERYADQMGRRSGGGSKDKQKLRKKRTHKKGKRTQRK